MPKKVFLLQTKTIRIMKGIKHRSKCRPAFKTLNIHTNIGLTIYIIFDDFYDKLFGAFYL
jgi:hypothetical protein